MRGASIIVGCLALSWRVGAAFERLLDVDESASHVEGFLRDLDGRAAALRDLDGRASAAAAASHRCELNCGLAGAIVWRRV